MPWAGARRSRQAVVSFGLKGLRFLSLLAQLSHTHRFSSTIQRHCLNDPAPFLQTGHFEGLVICSHVRFGLRRGYALLMWWWQILHHHEYLATNTIS